MNDLRVTANSRSDPCATPENDGHQGGTESGTLRPRTIRVGGVGRPARVPTPGRAFDPDGQPQPQQLDLTSRSYRWLGGDACRRSRTPSPARSRPASPSARPSRRCGRSAAAGSPGWRCSPSRWPPRRPRRRWWCCRSRCCTTGTPLRGLLTIVGATVLISLIAVCVTQFTRRQAAAGGLLQLRLPGARHPRRADHGRRDAGQVPGQRDAHALQRRPGADPRCSARLGVDVARARRHGSPCTPAVAVVVLAVLVRGRAVRRRSRSSRSRRARCCSSSALTVLPGAGAVRRRRRRTAPRTACCTSRSPRSSRWPVSRAPRSSAPRRNGRCVTITRTVLLTPMICGALFIFAAWAAWTGRSATRSSTPTCTAPPPARPPRW